MSRAEQNEADDRFLIRCSECEGYHEASWSDEFDDLLRTSCDEVGESSQTLYREFDLGAPGGRWDRDRSTAEIWWTRADGRICRGSYQLAGGWIEETGSWMWGWAHPQASEAYRIAAQKTHDLGMQSNFEVLTTDLLIIEEEDAWHLTKMVAHAGEYPGVYRAKVNNIAWAFFAIGRPEWVE